MASAEVCAYVQGRKKNSYVYLGKAFFSFLKSLLVRDTYPLRCSTWNHSPICSLFSSRTLHTSKAGQQTTTHDRHHNSLLAGEAGGCFHKDAPHPHETPTARATIHLACCLTLPEETICPADTLHHLNFQA